MQIYVHKSLILYCYKANNYNDFIRRVNILAVYLRKKFDKRLIHFLANEIANKERNKWNQ